MITIVETNNLTVYSVKYFDAVEDAIRHLNDLENKYLHAERHGHTGKVVFSNGLSVRYKYYIGTNTTSYIDILYINQ